MSPKHYYNYARKYGVRSADRRQHSDERLEAGRREQELVNNKTWGMGCNS